MNNSYAYDPVQDEDVPISNCRNLPHDFDVQEAVQHDEGDRHPNRETAREYEWLLSADMSHDPSEGCQGSYTKIVDLADPDNRFDEECPFCGYDRATYSTETLAGIHELTCRRCRSSIGGEHGESPPTLESDRVDDLAEYAEYDGPLVEIGHLNSSRSRFGAPTGPIYGYSDGTGLAKWVRNGSVHSARTESLVQIIGALLESELLDVSDAIEIFMSAYERIVDADAVDEIEDIDRGMIATSFLPEELYEPMGWKKSTEDQVYVYVHTAQSRDITYLVEASCKNEALTILEGQFGFEPDGEFKGTVQEIVENDTPDAVQVS